MMWKRLNDQLLDCAMRRDGIDAVLIGCISSIKQTKRFSVYLNYFQFLLYTIFIESLFLEFDEIIDFMCRFKLIEKFVSFI